MLRRHKSWASFDSHPVFNNGRRRRTPYYSESLHHINVVEHLRRVVARTIIGRLSANGVNTAGLSSMFLEHCLPVTIADKWSWVMLLQNSLLLLQYPRQIDPRASPAQQTVIYIRSFHMTVGQLREVAARFRETGHAHTKITEWLGSTHRLRADETVYIRYVGRTTRGVLQRHREDLLTRRAGFLAKFLTCLETMFPIIIDSVALYIFPTPVRSIPEVALCNEIREQAVIAVLGIHSLLNQTFASTAHRTFLPKESHRESFKALGTRTISRLLPSNFSPTSHDASLAAWADDIQRYARDHRDSVSRFRNTVHDFPDNLRNMITRQATPSKLYGKFVLFLTVGAGISHQAYQKQEAFYKGSSDSARMIEDFLGRLWSWEQHEPITEVRIHDIVSVGGLPFVDLCPWQRATGDDLKAAANSLKRYISITKPLILLTLSEKPSSVLRNGFSCGGEAPSMSNFWSRVGQVELVQTGSLCCIQIPCFHPGQRRFSAEPNIFLKIFDMTLWVLLLAISKSLDSVELYESRDRSKWCRYVKQQVDQVLSSVGFYGELNSLKDELYKERPKSTATALTVAKRSKIAIATRRDVDQFIFSGLAVDEAASDRRRQQTYRLWELNIPELHLHIGRERPREWFEWANSLPVGASLFVEAIAGAIWTSATTTEHGFSRRMDEGVVVSVSRDAFDVTTLPEEHRELFSHMVCKEWVRYTDVVETITANLTAKVPLWRFLHASRVSTEISQAGILRFKALYRPKLNGAEVFVWKNHSFPIYWIAPSKQRYKFVMRAPQSSLDSSLRPRKYIFFTVDGIDLRDEDGTSCLVRKVSLSCDNRVTFPVHHLPNCQDTSELGTRLVELWEYETGLRYTNRTPATLEFLHLPANTYLPSFYSGETLPLIRSNWNGDRLASYRSPPNPADETWLLWMCLKEQWPKGGTLFIGIPEKWPSRQDNIWVHLREFLSRPVYHHHPGLTRVQAWAQDLHYTHKTSQIIKNIEHLCHVVHKRKVQERDQARMKAEGKDVKIAGTELGIRQRW
ncbi:hypothetical protein BJY01DRAFT_259344 [Aspergillus pseudoustus]|uniref:Uncharacterized protein n=1 Tax=Aspergillus pseudoustus TaxID=1810923 RepID=A0ABR4J8A7_9EURO